MYGPYLVSRFFQPVDADHTNIYFTMSTWVPYQVVMMRAQLARTTQ